MIILYDSSKTFFHYLELIITGFSFPWLLLLFILFFFKGLKNLIERTSKVSYGETSIEFFIEDSRRELFLADKRLEQEHENLYGYPRKLEIGAGGVPTVEHVPEKYDLSFLLEDGKVESYYNKTNSAETLEKMYQLYINQYAKEFKLKSADYENVISDMENNSPEEIPILMTLNRFHDITFQNQKTSDIWNLSDIMKFKRMIVTALNLRNYRRNG